jgi:hypothetical protein
VTGRANCATRHDINISPATLARAVGDTSETSARTAGARGKPTQKPRKIRERDFPFVFPARLI